MLRPSVAPGMGRRERERGKQGVQNRRFGAFSAFPVGPVVRAGVAGARGESARGTNGMTLASEPFALSLDGPGRQNCVARIRSTEVGTEAWKKEWALGRRACMGWRR